MTREQRRRAYEAALRERLTTMRLDGGQRRPCVSCGLWTFLMDLDGQPRHAQCSEVPQASK